VLTKIDVQIVRIKATFKTLQRTEIPVQLEKERNISDGVPPLKERRPTKEEDTSTRAG